MNAIKFFHKLIPLLAVLLALTACAGNQADPTKIPPVGLANPADVYCQGLGYSTELVDRNGGQDSDCIFPDNTRCAAWDLLAGRCGQEFSFCEQQGGKMETSDGNIGNCRFIDGSFCSEIEYYTGDCQPGDNPD